MKRQNESDPAKPRTRRAFITDNILLVALVAAATFTPWWWVEDGERSSMAWPFIAGSGDGQAVGQIEATTVGVAVAAALACTIGMLYIAIRRPLQDGEPPTSWEVLVVVAAGALVAALLLAAFLWPGSGDYGGRQSLDLLTANQHRVPHVGFFIAIVAAVMCLFSSLLARFAYMILMVIAGVVFFVVFIVGALMRDLG